MQSLAQTANLGTFFVYAHFSVSSEALGAGAADEAPARRGKVFALDARKAGILSAVIHVYEKTKRPQIYANSILARRNLGASPGCDRSREPRGMKRETSLTNEMMRVLHELEKVSGTTGTRI